MKFSDFVYERPDMEQYRSEFMKLLARFNEAATFEEQDAAMVSINAARTNMSSLFAIARIRQTINTADPFYRAEQAFMDEHSPILQELTTSFYKALTKSKFRAQMEAKWGSYLFAKADVELKTFAPEIMDDLKAENKLVSKYGDLIASAKIMFDGKEYTLSQLTPFTQSKDRDTRKRATDARYSFFEANEAAIDEIYDELVKLRTSMARKMGYSNFIELAYARMGRTDYGPEQAAAFRDQVHKHIVPIASELSERRRVRLGLDSLHYYDSLEYTTGNPTPKGEPEWIVEQAKHLYAQLSPETDAFFRIMLEQELMDLESKPNKRVGGYCSYIDAYKVPFIFANFNQTAHDVDVLTHEAGHAFQKYMSRDFTIPEYVRPTADAAEIHSMSMEFFAWPWIHQFFKEDTDKYKFSHLGGAITFIPYGVAVDEYQHVVFENPEMTPTERKQAWREIEKKYIPTRVYDDMPFLERGGFWHQQLHLFNYPFYYIDYTLAQICALQYWKWSQENHAEAWDSYLKLCRAGGSLPFTGLVEFAGLQSPFKEGSVSSIVGQIRSWLNTIDDTKL